MSAKSIVSAFTGFLTHHVGDLNNLADALTGIASSLPIDTQQKDTIHSVIGDIKASADNIASFLDGNSVTGDGGEVTVKESDIETALANFFNSDAGKAALAAAVSAEGNASNG